MNLFEKVDTPSLSRLAKPSVDEASNQTHVFAWLVVQNHSGSCHPRWQLDAAQLVHSGKILCFEAKEENFLHPPQGQHFLLRIVSSISVKSVAKVRRYTYNVAGVEPSDVLWGRHLPVIIEPRSRDIERDVLRSLENACAVHRAVQNVGIATSGPPTADGILASTRLNIGLNPTSGWIVKRASKVHDGLHRKEDAEPSIIQGSVVVDFESTVDNVSKLKARIGRTQRRAYLGVEAGASWQLPTFFVGSAMALAMFPNLASQRNEPAVERVTGVGIQVKVMERGQGSLSCRSAVVLGWKERRRWRVGMDSLPGFVLVTAAVPAGCRRLGLEKR